MQLSDLTHYAFEKYQITEAHKWADFPGISVLVEPKTGKWAALLMREWNSELGEMTEKCDLRCGQSALTPKRSSFLSLPARMHGANWLGVSFNEAAEADLVFQLFDKAINDLRRTLQGCTIVLEGGTAAKDRDTPLKRGTPVLSGGGPSVPQTPDIPPKIREMLRLYEYGDGSFLQKCKNFCRQGRLMADYTDDEPWEQPYHHYFPTYHDMNLRQLRGYFTWRTNLRKGLWLKAPLSFAYLYLYELLNGIGTDGAGDSLARMEEFQRKFLDGGMGDERMREYLRRWMMEVSILNGLPAETVQKYIEPEIEERDRALCVLKAPGEHSDAEIFDALCLLSGKKKDFTPVVKKKGDEGKHLFALAWRQSGLFEPCFGRALNYEWHPLSNAVYFEEKPRAESNYVLNACRRYRYRNGHWKVECYEPVHFNRKKLQTFFRAADRLLRSYFKTGGALSEKPEEAWVQPIVQAAIDADRREKAEAARPKIHIDLSGLDQIRRDAVITRDSLLTEEERMELAAAGQEQPPAAESAGREEAPLNLQILRLLLSGGSADELIRKHRLMPTIAADSINEDFFDEIGDNIVETDGRTLSLVEDYREEAERIISRAKD